MADWFKISMKPLALLHRLSCELLAYGNNQLSGGAAEEPCPLYNDRIKQPTLILQQTIQFLLQKMVF